jgi:hypothetical protein
MELAAAVDHMARCGCKSGGLKPKVEVVKAQRWATTGSPKRYAEAAV